LHLPEYLKISGAKNNRQKFNRVAVLFQHLASEQKNIIAYGIPVSEDPVAGKPSAASAEIRSQLQEK
jgi:hypothetical protein